MGRRNRRRAEAPREPGAGPVGAWRREEWAGAEWVVRPVTGAATTKTYRCPGCDHEVAAGTPHVVVWPADDPGPRGGLPERRHWHTACWGSRAARWPRGRR